VFSLVPAEEILTCFIDWSISNTVLNPNDIIAIDGKTLKKSGNEAIDQKPLHLINADVTNKGITIDAMGTQKGIANLIVLKGADYVLALKKNHQHLYKRVKNLFEIAEKRSYQAMVYKENITRDYDHSRCEKREYTFLPIMYLPVEKENWRGLQTVIRVKSTRHLGSKKEEAFR